MFTLTRPHAKRVPRRLLSPRERRVVRMMIDADEARLRRVQDDPRLGPVAAKLLAAYRLEMLEDLRRRIESSLQAAGRRESRLKLDSSRRRSHSGPAPVDKAA